MLLICVEAVLREPASADSASADPDSTEAAFADPDFGWIIEALVAGVCLEAGAAVVVGSLTDERLAEAAEARTEAGVVVLVDQSCEDEVREACAAAAAGEVTLARAEPDSEPLYRVSLKNPNLDNTDHSHLRTIEVSPTRPRRSTWALSRFGRSLASIACEPQRLESSDRAVRRRSAAKAAVSSVIELLETEGVEEFQIRGGQAMIVQHSGGQRDLRDSPFDSDEDLIEAVRFLASYSGDRPQRFDELDPRLDIRVGNSWRLHAEAFVTSPPNVVLRSNMAGRMRLSDLGLASQELEAILLEAVAGQARANVVIAAAMGGGKTTLCQALLAAVPDFERIDTIEDTPELRLGDYGIHPNAFERLTRDPNQDGHGRHSMADHIRDAKRSNADKLVVGEIRGDGCAALLDAMSSGITGCLVTLHSQPGKGVLEKLTAYACSEGADADYARRQIAAAVDLCVWLGRNDQGQRVVADVTQLAGIDERDGVIATQRLWQLEPGQRWAQAVGEPSGRVAQVYRSAGVERL